MVRVLQLKFLVFALAVIAQPSSALAIQWPVHGGPVHQPVPQYRTSYPLFDSAPQPVKAKPKSIERLQTGLPAATTNGAISNPASPNLKSPQTPASIMERTPASRNPTANQNAVTEPPRDFPVTNAPALTSEPNRFHTDPGTQPGKTAPASRTPSEAASSKKPAAKQKPHTPVIDYSIYRDRNPLPIDPRKPNNICTNPGQCGCGHGCRSNCDAPGLRGKPFQEKEPGGCRCGDKKCGKSKPMFSVYWPRPYSAKLDEHFPAKAAARYSPCQKKRIVDVFDKFADFKLIDYQRTDNGYCGEDADPYGCLGESRMISSGVAGVGYRFPSVPVSRSASTETKWR